MVTKHTSPRHITCPFCALHCDDLTLRGRDNPGEALCRTAFAGYEAARSGGESRIGGEPARHEDALAEAQRLVKRARRPLVSGLGADVAGMRAALAFAHEHRAWLDPAASETQMDGLSVLQRQGMMTTTYSEVRNRADLVVALGPELFRAYPRFAERCLPATRSVDGTDLSHRKVVVLGPSRPPADLEGLDVTALKCTPEALPEWIQALTAHRRGGVGPALGKAVRDRVERLAALIDGAAYTAFVWQHDAWLGPHPALMIEALQDLILKINERDRAAALVLGGDSGAQTAQAVAAWQTGYAARIKCERGRIVYDPIRHAWRRLIARGETDLVVWVDAFGGLPAPDTGDIPLIVVGSTDAADGADVRLACGVPGVSHDAQFARGDGVVSLAARAPRGYADPARPDAAACLTALTG